MEEKANTGQVIIVLTEHLTFGTLLIPYMAEKSDDGTYQLIEQAFHASPEAISRMNEAEQQAIDIASHYTERYLMGIYSREKTVSRFLRKLSEDPERVKNNIRPFIEKKMQEMLSLIRHHNLPLYPAASHPLHMRSSQPVPDPRLPLQMLSLCRQQQILPSL